MEICAKAKLYKNNSKLFLWRQQGSKTADKSPACLPDGVEMIRTHKIA